MMNIKKLFKRVTGGNKQALDFIMNYKNMRRYAAELDFEDGRLTCLYIHGYAVGDKAIVWTELVFKENGKVTGNLVEHLFQLINTRDFEDAVDEYAGLLFTIAKMTGHVPWASDIAECPICNGGEHPHRTK